MNRGSTEKKPFETCLPYRNRKVAGAKRKGEFMTKLERNTLHPHQFQMSSTRKKGGENINGLHLYPIRKSIKTNSPDGKTGAPRELEINNKNGERKERDLVN